MTTPQTQATALLVDDESSVLDSLTILLRRGLSLRVRACSTVAEANEALEQGRPDVMITDISMEGREAGVELLERARALYPDLPVILMSAVGSRDAAIRAINANAFAFLQKPFRNEALTGQVRAALAQGAIRSAARASVQVGRRQADSKRHNQGGARGMAKGETGGMQVVGESASFLDCVALVEQAAPTEVTVLFEGESGVGKGVLANHLHAMSPRAARPFIPVNCGAFTETLLESQLFGHLKGSFTGADRDTIGFVRAADGGTLFLDEVGELTPATQVKLLRVLQEREVIPVGGTEAARVDVRFVAATNRDLRAEVTSGRFREDLFWRLHVMSITVPPLRERRDDVPLLARGVLERLRSRDANVSTEISAEAMAALQGWEWPGNVRELENALTRAVVVSGGQGIAVEHLPVEFRRTLPPTVPSVGRALSALQEIPTLALVERLYVEWVMAQCGGDAASAAARLGLPIGAMQGLLGGPMPER